MLPADTSHVKKHTCIYLRVSTEDQGRGYSLSTQRAACLQYAQQHGYTVLDHYVFSDDTSGSTLDRPGLQALRRALRTLQGGAVIVHDLDRLSRRMVHQIVLAEEFGQQQIQLHIVTMPNYADSPEGRLLANVKSTIGEYEREKIAERCLRGLRGRAEAGQLPGGQVPLGYKAVRKPHQTSWEIQADEAALVQRIYSMAIQGLTCGKIAEQLSREAVPTKRDREGQGKKQRPYGAWSTASVYNILTYAPYASGYLSYSGKSTSGEVIAIAIPHIITQDVFDAVQAQFQRSKRQARRNRMQDYLLAGRIQCGICGRRMHGLDPTPHRRDTRRYRCVTATLGAGIKKCRLSIKAATIEHAIWQRVQCALANPAFIAQEVQRQVGEGAAQLADLDAQERTITMALEQCDIRYGRWNRAFESGVIDAAELQQHREEIEAQRRQLMEEAKHITRGREFVLKAQQLTRSLEALCVRVRERLRTFGAAEKHLAIGALDIHVTMFRERRFSVTAAISLGDIKTVQL
jgi:site-specific DNA recombinase